MKKTFDAAYELNEKVKVGNTFGTVRGYYVDANTIEYHVSIWDGSKRDTFYFRECELEKYVEPEKPLGLPLPYGSIPVRYTGDNSQPIQEIGTEIKYDSEKRGKG